MKAFAELCLGLERSETPESGSKLLSTYLSRRSAQDSAWTLWILLGGKRRFISVQSLKKACIVTVGIPEWLYAECMSETGDASETMALLLAGQAKQGTQSHSLTTWMESLLPTLGASQPHEAQGLILDYWMQSEPESRLILNKLMTGTQPVKVSQSVVAGAVSCLTGVPPEIIQARLTVPTVPDEKWYTSLASPASDEELRSAQMLLESEHRTSCTAVLMYAERGISGELILFTFGVWHEDALMSVAKVPWDCDREVQMSIESFVRDNTLERRGPIRVVPPQIVVRIEFDEVVAAPRRKAGFELIRPGVVELMREADIQSASQLQWLKGLIAG